MGQGTHEVSVAWLLEEGVITVQEANADGCEGDEVSSGGRRYGRPASR